MAEPDDELALETGGPSWTLWLKTGLAPATPRPLALRALLLAGLCFVPLLALSLYGGLAFGGSVRVPFARDFAVYGRFLVAVSLLVVADAAVAGRLRRTLAHFHAAKLVPPESEPAFAAAVARARRRAASPLAELAMLALAYLLAWTSVRRELADGVSTWHALVAGTGERLTGAGWWYALVSVPVLQFLLLRWLYRGVVWTALLARISRLELRLVATHADHAGGLGFLAHGQAGFAVIVLAVSVSVAGVLGDAIVYHDAPLESLVWVGAAFVAIAVLLVLAPLLVFTPRLLRLKREALFAYGALVTAHDEAFRAKWVRPDAEREALLGKQDASSLIDLSSSYEVIGKLRPLPLDLPAAALVALAALVPMLPLVLTKIPLRDVLLGLVRVLL